MFRLILCYPFKHHHMSESKDHVWHQIPLDDYEKHMSHETVGQLQLLSHLTKTYLQDFQPETALFLGVAGGNGLEHIDPTITTQVFGVDINEKYLEACRLRLGEQLPNLQLRQLDITQSKEEQVCQADFVWVALVVEYTRIEPCLAFVKNNLKTGGKLIVTIQVNNGAVAVSPTGVESIKVAGDLFVLVDADELSKRAEDCGLVKQGFKEHFLPNGKSFKTFVFERSL